MKSRRFFRLVSSQGVKAALWRVFYLARRRLGAYARNRPVFSFRNISELETLRRNISQCQDSIRHLTELLTAASSTLPAAVLKISVIMPVYNRAGIIHAAIRSVLAQEGVDFELIIADDGSTDALNSDTIPELEALQIRLLRLPHKGVCAARNQALAVSQGDVVVYLDSDNRMYPGYLRAVAAAYAANPDALCGYAAMLWDDGANAVHLRHDEFSWSGLLTAQVNIDLNSFSHRRHAWQALGGFDENLTKHADYDLALRYAREQRPLRIAAVAAWYYAGNEFSRLSRDEDSEINIHYIRAKHMHLSGRKPRVLIACFQYPQQSESYIDTEIDFCLRQGYEVEVWGQETPGSPGVPRVKLLAGGLQRAIDKFQPDLIHAHWLTVGIEIAEIARRAGIPVTVRSHGFEFSRAAFRKCAAQEAVKSIYLFPHLMTGMGRRHKKAHAVTSAFNTTRYFPRPRNNPKMVLRTAACLDTKNIEMFFEAAVRCPEFSFVLVMAKVSALPDLPARFEALNASLGNPVDLRFDISAEEITALVAEAGIYLHTFGFTQPFGMPVSIIEALACGALTLVADCREARQYAGPHALYYKNLDDAVGHIRNTLTWTDADWREQKLRSADFARKFYADDTALMPILDDWHRITRGVEVWDGMATPEIGPKVPHEMPAQATVLREVF